MEISTRLGPYRLDELTGEGSVAQVYKAWHMNLQRFEALKLLRDSMAHEETIVARFLSEARTAAKLSHRHIATIYSVGDGNGSRPYFTMELIKGRDLGEHLRRRGPLTLSEAAPLLHQIAEAIDYAHSVGVIHRDIKPANILLEDMNSGGYMVKLVDFGISRVAEEDAAARLTQTGGIVGTPKYISPEQANEQPVDYRSDIYSFGVVAYEMMCGRTPFESSETATAMALLMAHVHNAPPPPRELAPSLSQTTSDALLRCLAKSPGERFSTCGEFVRVLTAPRGAEPSSPVIGTASPAAPSPPAETKITFSAAPKVTQAVESSAPPAVTNPRRTILTAIGAAAAGALAVCVVFAFTHKAPPPTPIGRKIKAPVISVQRNATPPLLSKPIHAPTPVAAQKAAPAVAPPKVAPRVTAQKVAPPPTPAKAPMTLLVNHTEAPLPAPVKLAPKNAVPSPPAPTIAKVKPAVVVKPTVAAVKPAVAVVRPAVAAVKPTAPAVKPATSAAKPAVRKTAQPHLAIAAAHTPIRNRRVRAAQLRRKSRVQKAHPPARIVKVHTLADAWKASYRKELALSHSFRAKGDLVQANALAQNAEDSRRHATLTPKPKPKAKKRKLRH
ncbi:MAG: protein kinase [Capsulimonas sp.]|uniref:serine/threonine-protein kinase n=1 Tax=Capsulimonas sp. TaxID=2494211 RepID=UPI003264EF2D